MEFRHVVEDRLRPHMRTANIPFLAKVRTSWFLERNREGRLFSLSPKELAQEYTQTLYQAGRTDGVLVALHGRRRRVVGALFYTLHSEVATAIGLAPAPPPDERLAAALARPVALEVSLLWVRHAYRGRRVGSTLLRMAHGVGSRLGCQMAILQPPENRISYYYNHPGGHSYSFLSPDIVAAASSPAAARYLPLPGGAEVFGDLTSYLERHALLGDRRLQRQKRQRCPLDVLQGLVNETLARVGWRYLWMFRPLD